MLWQRRKREPACLDSAALLLLPLSLIKSLSSCLSGSTCGNHHLEGTRDQEKADSHSRGDLKRPGPRGSRSLGSVSHRMTWLGEMHLIKVDEEQRVGTKLH